MICGKQQFKTWSDETNVLALCHIKCTGIMPHQMYWHYATSNVLALCHIKCTGIMPHQMYWHYATSNETYY